jgi:hypothetical protein
MKMSVECPHILKKSVQPSDALVLCEPPRPSRTVHAVRGFVLLMGHRDCAKRASIVHKSGRWLY